MKRVIYIGVFLSGVLGCVSYERSAYLKKPKKLRTVVNYLKKKLPDTTRNSGPFNYRIQRNYKITLAPNETITGDLITSSHDDVAPLAIIQHGNHADKDVHHFQGLHLASWGFHSLVLEQPNVKRWIANGYRLSKLVTLLTKWPDLIGKKFDPRKIILIGHSFGSSAISLATALGAPAKGLILLDPALYSTKIIKYLKKVNRPAIILGADKKIFRSRKRSVFFSNLKGAIAEVSITGATHNDAQYPSRGPYLGIVGFDFSTDENLQREFLGAIVYSSYSLAYTDGYALAWQHFNRLHALGVMHGLRKK